MTIDVKKLSDQDLQEQLEELRSSVPVCESKPKKKKKAKQLTLAQLSGQQREKERKQELEKKYSLIPITEEDRREIAKAAQEHREKVKTLFEPGEPKEYEVWSEGYAATGEHGYASLEGAVVARSFGEACVKVLGHRASFNKEMLTIWGCHLFDNQVDAIKSFG